jgi:hypothetical protein
MASMQSLAAQLTAPVALVMELLAWVAARPRTYGETMEAWRTSCPRMPVWEDAIGHGLVTVVPGEVGVGKQAVSLTAKGRALLDRHAT